MIKKLTQKFASHPEKNRVNLRASKELKGPTDFYLRLFDDFPIPVWRSSTDAKCDYVNKAWLELTGRKLEMELGDGWAKGLHPDDIAKVMKHYTAAFHARRPFELEYRVRHRDGSYHTLVSQGRPHYGLKGSFRGYFGSCYDITERTQAVEALRESEEKYRNLVAEISDGIFITDTKGVITFANPALARIPGLQHPEELVGKKFMQFVAPRMVSEVARRFRELIEGTHSQLHMDVEIVRLDGTPAMVDVRASAKMIGRKVISTHGVVRDITAHRRADDAMRRLAAIVESSEDAIIGKTIKGIITSWNRGAEKIYGYSAKEIIGRPISLLFPPGQKDELPRIIKRIKSGIPIENFETVRVRRDGGLINVSVTISPVRDNTGKITGSSTVARDITQRKLADDALINSHKQLRALAARLEHIREEESTRISREIHDVLGQALTSLNIDVNWLENHVARRPMTSTPSEIRKRLKGMETLLHICSETVQRISSDLRPSILDDLGLAAALEWVTEDWSRRTGIRSRWLSKPQPVVLNRDQATALFRIYQEILTNISRHAHATRVTCSFKTKSSALILEVRDNGRGFDPAKLSGRKSLGLLGMRERALLFAGKLQIQSAPGKGTLISVQIPLSFTSAKSADDTRSRLL